MEGEAACFDLLPNELVELILAKLDSRSLCRLATQCRRLWRLANVRADQLLQRMSLEGPKGHHVWESASAVRRQVALGVPA